MFASAMVLCYNCYEAVVATCMCSLRWYAPHTTSYKHCGCLEEAEPRPHVAAPHGKNQEVTIMHRNTTLISALLLSRLAQSSRSGGMAIWDWTL